MRFLHAKCLFHGGFNYDIHSPFITSLTPPLIHSQFVYAVSVALIKRYWNTKYKKTKEFLYIHVFCLSQKRGEVPLRLIFSPLRGWFDSVLFYLYIHLLWTLPGDLNCDRKGSNNRGRYQLVLKINCPYIERNKGVLNRRAMPLLTYLFADLIVVNPVCIFCGATAQVVARPPHSWDF
jgi:hypothetical protein